MILCNTYKTNFEKNHSHHPQEKLQDSVGQLSALPQHHGSANEGKTNQEKKLKTIIREKHMGTDNI